MELISRESAAAAGLSHFFTGNACRNGHIARRLVSTGSCFECDKSRMAKYVAGIPGVHSKRCAEWRANNKGRMAELRRAWVERNQVKHAEQTKRWHKDNPKSGLATQHKRRARKLNATPHWFGELDEFLVQEAASLRRERELATGISWHIDHMIPLLAKGACGLHCAANLQVIPAAMNNTKRNSMALTEPWEWLQWL